jgi:Erv1 / Alr family
MSLTVAQSNYNAANIKIQQPVRLPATSATILPFTKRNFSSMTLSMIPNNNNITTLSPILPRSLPQQQDPQFYKPRAVDPTSISETKPKMLWGKPTWYLLHMIAEKIKPEEFVNIRISLLMLIVTICSNLPCPICATHAKEYLTKNKFTSIQTRDDLKDFFYQFHNYVNTRKNYTLLSRNELDILYLTCDPASIINNFIKAYNTKTKNIRLLADDLNRKYIADSVNKFFKKYLIHFNGPIN